MFSGSVKRLRQQESEEAFKRRDTMARVGALALPARAFIKEKSVKHEDDEYVVEYDADRADLVKFLTDSDVVLPDDTDVVDKYLKHLVHMAIMFGEEWIIDSVDVYTDADDVVKAVVRGSEA